MTKRKDIVDGSKAKGRKYGLIYTRKCGWVDLGHANPAGALDLWQRVYHERGHKIFGRDDQDYYRIEYKQMMGNNYIKVGISSNFKVKKGLSLAQKKSVALAIFLNVSRDFEGMQGNIFFRQFTDSGYSAEDLVSNLIGFYRAVNPSQNYLKQCNPVSKKEALYVWDTYGAVGKYKNKTTSPYIFPTNPNLKVKPKKMMLPNIFTKITPMKKGELFQRY